MLVGAGLVGSCSGKTTDAGGLMLTIGRDGPLPIDRLDIEVEYEGKVLRKTSYRVPEEASLPTSLAIASNGDSSAGINIVVVGWSKEVPLDRRDAIVTQVPNDRVARLDIVLSGRCSKRVTLEADGTAISTCGEGRTCAPETGNCTDAKVDAQALPTFSSGDDDQVGLGGSDGVGGAGGSGVGGSGVGGSITLGGNGGEGAAVTPLGGMGGSDEPVTMAGAGGEAGAPAIPGFCSDGALDPGEACDDGNQDFADGCTGDCRHIEANYDCDLTTNVCSPTAVCGNGILETPFESCDDGNVKNADGCSATCQLESAFKCGRPGTGCSPVTGDGKLSGWETCDDGNQTAGDGCSASGQLEPGYDCSMLGAKCTFTVCGDGKAQGVEPCDDGNFDNADGCTFDCRYAPSCPLGVGGCAPLCGDGALDVATEGCDDGNKLPFDGCDPTCQIEPGYVCATTGVPVSTVPIVYRDFISWPTGGSTKHPDFEGFNAPATGMVKTSLGVNGKPELNTPCPSCPVTSSATFNQWFTDVQGTNITSAANLALSPLTAGVERFQSTAFFPLDGKGWVAAAKESPQSAGHNFGFTSEARFWFTYHGSEAIDFTGDDDVWVFVAGKLVIDLGGVHGALSANATLVSLGLTVGKVYEVAIFQAERHVTLSNYTLTLSNFSNSKSTCAPSCGNGVRTPNEECDQGASNGTNYSQCDPTTCKLNASCGDGVKQAPEACDSGAGVVYGGCAADCTERICGDRNVQAGFEQCDDGNTDPGDGCSATCQLE